MVSVVTEIQAPVLRPTGLDILGEMPWGTHFSLFYEARQDLIDVIVPYFVTGLMGDELCLWLSTDRHAEDAARNELLHRVPNFEAREATGQIEFTVAADWYHQGGRFDVDEALTRWHELERRARAQGYTGLRISGDMGWVGESERTRIKMYEARLQEFVCGRSMMTLCTYPLGHSPAADMLDLALAHHCVFARRNGHWESVQTPEYVKALREIERLNRDLERRVDERTAELRRSESYLAEGQRLAHSGSFAWDCRTGEYTFWSAEQFRIFGLEPSAAPPPLDDVIARIHPDDRGRFFSAREAGPREVRAMKLTVRVILPSGRIRYVHGVTHPVMENGLVTEVVGVDIDITDRKRAAARVARMRRLAREQAIEARFAAILEERSRMARELHDSLLQGVTGIALQLRALLPRLQTEAPEMAESVRRVTEMAESTGRDARRTVWEMRPAALVRSDLPGALEETVRRVAPALDVTVEVGGAAMPLNALIEDTILRIAQEAVANAVKHSGSPRVAVSLAYEPNAVTLTVADKGGGFDVASAFHTYLGRWGLLGMRERADRIGASLDVRSRPGQGTTVELRVPLREERRVTGSSA